MQFQFYEYYFSAFFIVLMHNDEPCTLIILYFSNKHNALEFTNSDICEKEFCSTASNSEMQDFCKDFNKILLFTEIYK